MFLCNYSYTRRVQLPDKSEILINFGAFETPKSLYAILEEKVINNDIKQWSLFTNAPKLVSLIFDDHYFIVLIIICLFLFCSYYL